MTDREFDEALQRRRDFFQRNFPMLKIARKRMDVNSNEILKNSCPVCGYLTLSERDAFEICGICFWEDDGTENFEADQESGPNHMTLTEARIVFSKAKIKLNTSEFEEGDFRKVLKTSFIKLDGLISDNKTTELREIQRLTVEIIGELEKHKIYRLEKAFT